MNFRAPPFFWGACALANFQGVKVAVGSHTNKKSGCLGLCATIKNVSSGAWTGVMLLEEYAKQVCHKSSNASSGTSAYVVCARLLL